MSGWLVAQLPRVLAQDRFTRRFVSLFEELIDEVRTQIDAIEYYVDVDAAPPEFVRWLGSWLDITVEASLPEERQQEIVRTAGSLFARRGTAEGLRGLLATMTGAEVRIVDGGGTWPQGAAPLNPGRLLVRLTDTGGVPEDHLHRIIASEVPIGVSFELRLGDRVIGEPPAPSGVMEIIGEELGVEASQVQQAGSASSAEAPPPGDAPQPGEAPAP